MRAATGGDQVTSLVARRSRFPSWLHGLEAPAGRCSRGASADVASDSDASVEARRGGAASEEGTGPPGGQASAQLRAGSNASLEDRRRRSASNQGPRWSDGLPAAQLTTDPAASVADYRGRSDESPRPLNGAVGTRAAVDRRASARLGNHRRRPTEATGARRDPGCAPAELAPDPVTRLDDHPRANSRATWSCLAANGAPASSGHRRGCASWHRRSPRVGPGELVEFPSRDSPASAIRRRLRSGPVCWSIAERPSSGAG